MEREEVSPKFDMRGNETVGLEQLERTLETGAERPEVVIHRNPSHVPLPGKWQEI